MDGLFTINPDDEDDLEPLVRRNLIQQYAEFIGKCGFNVIKVSARKDDFLYSLKALVKFTYNEREVYGFFAAIRLAEFSLLSFRDEVVNGTNQSRLDFEKAIKARVVHYTTEEVICALLSDNYNLKIDDIYKNNTLIIPLDYFDRLFELFNMKAGNLKGRTTQRQVKR